MSWTPEPIDKLWKLFCEGEPTSLLKDHLTPDVYAKLKDKKTPLNGTLAHCINAGCLHLDARNVGIYPCDPDAYTVFDDVFTPVIKSYHGIDKLEHPASDYGTPEQIDSLENFDPEGKIVVSTRVRVGRSHAGYPFPPMTTAEQFTAMEQKTVEALTTLTGELAGKYYPLREMDPATQERMVNEHFLYRSNNPILESKGGYKYWDTGRGIFHNNNKTFLVWVNEEDHLRLISMQNGGDLAQVYRRLVKAIHELEKRLQFARKEGYGYLAFCPSNIGTTMRASVHMAIPNACRHPRFSELCDKYELQCRGVHGDHSGHEGDVRDLSNKRRLGKTEVQLVMEMHRGVKAILELEIELAAKK